MGNEFLDLSDPDPTLGRSSESGCTALAWTKKLTSNGRYRYKFYANLMILVEFIYYSSFFPESQEPAALPKFRDPEPDPPRKGVIGYGTAPLLKSKRLAATWPHARCSCFFGNWLIAITFKRFTHLLFLTILILWLILRDLEYGSTTLERQTVKLTLYLLFNITSMTQRELQL